jgi:hypothetical protein
MSADERHCYIIFIIKIVLLISYQSSDTEQVFGHTVIYFVTDPDKKHDYSLSIHYII